MGGLKSDSLRYRFFFLQINHILKFPDQMQLGNALPTKIHVEEVICRSFI